MRKEHGFVPPASEMSHPSMENDKTQLPSEPSGETVESFSMLHPVTNEKMYVNAHLDRQGKTIKLYGYNDEKTLVYFENIDKTSQIRLAEILKNSDGKIRNKLISQLDI